MEKLLLHRMNQSDVNFQRIFRGIAAFLKNAVITVCILAGFSMIYACGTGNDNENLGTSSVRISGTTSVNASLQAVANNGDGQIIAVWSEGAYGARRLKFNTYEPNEGWGQVRPAGTDIGDEADAKVAMNSSGNATLVWIRRNNGESELLVAGFNALDGWGTPVVLDTGVNDDPDVTLDDNGNAAAVWSRSGTGAGMVARYVSGVWSEPQILHASASEGGQKLSGNGAGSAMVIWNQNTPTEMDNVYNTWVAQCETGSACSSPAALGDDIAITNGIYFLNPQSIPGHYLPMIKLDAQNNAFAFWLEVNFTGDCYGILTKHFEDGVGWGAAQLVGSTPSDLDTTFSNSYSPITLGNSGSAYFSWSVTEDPVDYGDSHGNVHHSDVFVAVYQPLVGWTTQKILSAYPRNCFNPAAVEGKNGTLYLGWLQNDGNSAAQLWAKGRSAESGWSAAALLDASATSVGAYKAVRDDAGNVMVIWSGNAGIRAKLIN